MIKRFVKMTFKPEFIEDFKSVFNSHKNLISSFEGCSHLELLQDVNNPVVFFTFSIWDEKKHLESYRQSSEFKAIWGQTKIFFSQKAEAWSMKGL
jgi:heme-degrading monooxygenase HmoA